MHRLIKKSLGEIPPTFQRVLSEFLHSWVKTGSRSGSPLLSSQGPAQQWGIGGTCYLPFPVVQRRRKEEGNRQKILERMRLIILQGLRVAS